MQITRAVIPVAGFGTRMLPAAKAIPKELLPVLDRPTLQYVIEEASAAGLSDMILVTSPEKPAIDHHFSPNLAIEQRLGPARREALLGQLNELLARIRIHSVLQHEQRGLGHAVAQARDAIGGEPFLCMLGDTIFSGDVSPSRQLIDAHARYGTSVIGLEQVPEERVERYGIVGGNMIEPGVLRLNTLVEKPARDQAPSRLAIAARYVLTPAIFECLDHTPPGKGGEIQLTDAIKLLLQREPIHGIVLASKRHDIGNPLDWLKTNLIFAARDPSLWRQLRPVVESLLNEHNMY